MGAVGGVAVADRADGEHLPEVCPARRNQCRKASAGLPHVTASVGSRKGGRDGGGSRRPVGPGGRPALWSAPLASPSRCHLGAPSAGWPPIRVGHRREFHEEAGTLRGWLSTSISPAVLLDDAAGDGEAEARAALRLGGEEGLEEVVEVAGFDSGPAIPTSRKTRLPSCQTRTQTLGESLLTPPVASMAFTTRFVTTCPSWVREPRTEEPSPSRARRVHPSAGGREGSFSRPPRDSPTRIRRSCAWWTPPTG